MIQRYTFGTQKPDRDSERGEYVLFAEHQRVVSRLLAALKSMMPQPLTGNPTREQLIRFWESEQSLGRGEAPDVLEAYSVMAGVENFYEECAAIKAAGG